MFVAYRLTMLKVFPSLFANSVWLMPLTSNTSFILFIFAFFCLTVTKIQNFIWYIACFSKESANFVNRTRVVWQNSNAIHRIYDRCQVITSFFEKYL